MEKLKIKVKLMHPLARVPVQREEDDGADLSAIHDDVLYPEECKRIDLGIAVEIPKGYVGLVLPRSGLSLNRFSDEVGTIDHSYRGRLSAIAKNDHPKGRWVIKTGDRIAQLVVLPCPRVEYEATTELSDSARGERGFGSTGVATPEGK